jgi:hypothetical protein
MCNFRTGLLCGAISLACVSTSIAASDVAARLRGHYVCYNDGSKAHFGSHGSYDFGDKDKLGKWSVKGNTLYLKSVKLSSHRIDMITIGDDNSVHLVTGGGVNSKEETMPIGVQYDGHFCD